MTNLPHTYPCARLEKMVSEKRRREEKAEAQATIWRGPGKAGMNHHSVHSVFPWREHKEEQWTRSSRDRKYDREKKKNQHNRGDIVQGGNRAKVDKGEKKERY